MNTVTNNTTIHLHLNYINVMEVIILLMTYFNKVCVSNKREDLNLGVFKIITAINESKTLKKHISCECKCKYDRRKCNSNQKWNNDKC